jgi:hypothetical protein
MESLTSELPADSKLMQLMRAARQAKRIEDIDRFLAPESNSGAQRDSQPETPLNPWDGVRQKGAAADTPHAKQPEQTNSNSELAPEHIPRTREEQGRQRVRYNQYGDPIEE